MPVPEEVGEHVARDLEHIDAGCGVGESQPYDLSGLGVVFVRRSTRRG
jgi:hypothetical protein